MKIITWSSVILSFLWGFHWSLVAGHNSSRNHDIRESPAATLYASCPQIETKGWKGLEHELTSGEGKDTTFPKRLFGLKQRRVSSLQSNFFFFFQFLLSNSWTVRPMWKCKCTPNSLFGVNQTSELWSAWKCEPHKNPQQRTSHNFETVTIVALRHEAKMWTYPQVSTLQAKPDPGKLQ